MKLFKSLKLFKSFYFLNIIIFKFHFIIFKIEYYLSIKPQLLFQILKSVFISGKIIKRARVTRSERVIRSENNIRSDKIIYSDEIIIEDIQIKIKFEKALRLKRLFPEKAKIIFHELLEYIMERKTIERKTIEGRIYYNLATLSDCKQTKLEFYRKCIDILPEHSKAKDRYAEIIHYFN